MFVPVQLDKMRNLRYGMKAISLIEKKFGKSIAKIDMDDMTMEEIATFVWAGLVHEDKELTVEKVMDLVDEYSTVQTVMEKVSEAMNLAFGGTVEKK
ncbi:MAG: hypothetical protein KatS3mg079_682 [Caloramator sp.]|nr:MAG: hypothetical protein KatS3mg079_682 [Caloramator sp.]